MGGLLTLLLTVLYLLVPGLLLALVVRMSLVVALGAAPVLTFGLVAVLTRVSSVTGVAWRPVSFLVGVGLSAALLWVLRRLVRSPRLAAVPVLSLTGPPARAATVGTGPPAGAVRWVVLATTVAAAVLGTSTAIRGMGGLRGINQGFDALFHVNAVTLIAETGSADPASIGAVNRFEYGASYYPDAFHALAALVVDSGSSPVPATNALVAVVPAVLAAGLAALLWRMGLFRHAAVVPFVAVSVAAFPYDLMWRGPIWPYALGVALIPSFLALLTAAFEDRRRGVAALVALAAAGLLLVHPSAALAAGVFSAGFFGQRWAQERTALRRDVLPLLLVAGAAVVLALPAVRTAVANSGYGATYDWPAVQTAGTAVGDLLLFNYDAPLPQLWLAALLVAGLVGLRQLGRVAWWLSAAAFFVVLLVLAASYEGPWVALLTGPWWNDRFRFVGLAVLGIAVLCTHGVLVVADRVAALAGRVTAGRVTAGRITAGRITAGRITAGRVTAGRITAGRITPREAPARSRGWLAAGLVLAVFAVVTQGFYADYNRSRMQKQYAPGTGGSVTAAELAAFDVLADLVEPGETVMNDPNDGTAWMWALRDVRPMFGQAVLTPIRPPLEPDQQLVLDRFNCLDSSPAVRDVLAEYDVRYAIVGTGFIIPTMQRAPGLTGLGKARSLRPVYDRGGVRIYAIDLQPLVPPAADEACADDPPESSGA